MALALPGSRFIARFIVEQGLSGDVLTLGKQGVPITLEKYLAFLKTLFQPEGPNPARMTESDLQRLIEQMRREGTLNSTLPGTNPDFISDHFFYRALGMRSVQSVDVSSFEGADHRADLNVLGQFAEVLGRQFDLIHDGGTLEHVFHVPNALSNVYDVAKVGGHVIHYNPMNNNPDHGFYQFSPTLYHDYYSANRFKILKAFVFRVGSDPLEDPYMAMEYTPGCLDIAGGRSFGDGSLYLNGFFVQKTAESTAGKVPQQSLFSRYG